MIDLSAIDGQRFGHVVARAEIGSLTDLRTAETFCADNKVRLLIARIPTAELSVAQALMRAGGLLTDTLLVLRRDLSRNRAALAVPPAPPDGAVIRCAGSQDAAKVGELARVAFHDYLGHYHCDRRLDRKDCSDAYADWASRSCTDRSVSDRTLIAEMAGTVVGFMGLRIVSAVETFVTLTAVAPPARGRGLHRTLLRHHLAFSVGVGATGMVYATQVTNRAALLTLMRERFEPCESYYTLHKWLDEPGPESATTCAGPADA